MSPTQAARLLRGRAARVLVQNARGRYDTVLNIGCAEGYYAIGIKRLLPAARVIAFDITPGAREACRALAEKNGVEVEVGGEFRPADLERFFGKVLVWCDIEGGEIELLDRVVAPALAGMDVVVELHSNPLGHTTLDVISPRFATTHDVQILQSRGHDPALPPFLRKLSHLDRLLAQWEWRLAPTPWAIMRALHGN